MNTETSTVHPTRVVDAMVMKAARALCERQVVSPDEGDYRWEQFSADFITDAQAALTACGALECLEALEGFVNNSSAQVNMPTECERGETAIAKVYGSAPE
jgi:hypothetical protein